MITISLMFVFKLISLLFLGIMMLAFISSTFQGKQTDLFTIIVFTILVATPFIYILLN